MSCQLTQAVRRYEIVVTKKLNEMKIYRNEKIGFEINMPEEWSFAGGQQVSHALGKDDSLSFLCGANEAFNLQIGLCPSPTPLSETEDEFRNYAKSQGYTALEIGRCIVKGSVHVWARYYMGNGAWTKKYMIVLGETEYSITATCFDKEQLAEKEKTWDAIVASFHLLSK